MTDQRILIIKTGASGDVIRTSVLLHILKGEVTWITQSYNKALLPQQHPLLKGILSVEEAAGILNEKFDLVISLDDDDVCATLASKFDCKELIGVYKKDNHVQYTPHLQEWFDMSLISKFGIAKADEIKLNNRETFQALLFKGFDNEFNHSHAYLINESIRHKPVKKRIGIEARAGGRWPTKAWNGYEKVAALLRNDGYEPYFFEQRDLLTDYMHDIATCNFVFTGDTLAMHIALALKIPTVTIFTCTSPWEICDYGIMKKIISPFLAKAFYKNTYISEAVDSITVDSVYSALRLYNL